jgi:hypothetical protein
LPNLNQDTAVEDPSGSSIPGVQEGGLRVTTKIFSEPEKKDQVNLKVFNMLSASFE